MSNNHTPSPITSGEALKKLCDQLDAMRRTMFLRPGTGQNYSYLVHEDVAAYVEEARAALSTASAASAPVAQSERELAYGNREDFYLLANARRIGLMPIHQVVRMSNWVLAKNLFATGSTSAYQICRDAGIDPDGYSVTRSLPAIAAQQPAEGGEQSHG